MTETTSFDWSRIGEEVCDLLSAASGNAGAEDGVAALNRVVGRPPVEWVRKRLPVLRRCWLARDPWAASEVYDTLRGLGALEADRRMPRGAGARGRALATRRDSWALAIATHDALVRAGEGRRPRRTDDLLLPLEVIPTSGIPGRSPLRHQSEALTALRGAFAAGAGHLHGLMVMPTGAGKTFTAARFLCEDVVASGGRVLWVCHTHELLEQAARTFGQEISSLRHPRRVRMRVVSGAHGPVSAIGDEDQVVIASLASLRRRWDIVAELMADPRLTVCVDEAHHSPAASYRRLVRDATEAGRPLLGLTATPTRMNEGERATLLRQWGWPPLVEVDALRLVNEGVLARPRLVTVRTGREFESEMTAAHEKFVREFEQLPAEVLERIGADAARNRLIVAHYLENREHYGQTVVFAADIEHAATLASAFAKEGVSAGWISHLGSDTPALLGGEAGAWETPAATVARFRRRELAVLINVRLLTEGADLPEAESVFLTRPTRSAGLMRQMIGRGMRGPAVGGTPEVRLVCFADEWRRLGDFLSPFAVLEEDGLVAVEVVEDETRAERSAPEPAGGVEHDHTVGLQLLRQAWEAAGGAGPMAATVEETVPVGWLELRHQGMRPDHCGRAVPVYAHQLPSFERLLAAWVEGDRDAEAVADAFADCPDPLPADVSVEALRVHLEEGGTVAAFAYELRDALDPARVAASLLDVPARDWPKRIVETARPHADLVASVWGSEGRYAVAVHDAVKRQLHGAPTDEAAPCALPPLEDVVSLRPGPAHDLQEIYRAVCAEHFPEPLWVPTLRWSDPAGLMQWAFYRRSDRLLVIHRALDSPDVPREVLEFLVYHELLHLEHWDWGHNAEFRELERRHPSCVRAERFLDGFHANHSAA